MSQVKEGDTVKVHYIGKLESGTVFDNSKDREPLEFIVGKREVIPGLEKGVIGMGIGEKKTLTIPPEEGYGKKRRELIVDVQKANFPKNITPYIGEQMQVQQDDGQLVDVIVANISRETITLDANNPLAGRTLIFDVELVGCA